MAEKNENVEEKRRNENIESQANISDNNRAEINEELKQKFEEVEYNIGKIGYKCEVVLNNDNMPETILVYGKKDNSIIATYSEKGFQALTPEGLEFQEEFHKLEKKIQNLKDKVKTDKNDKNKKQGNREEEKEENKEEQKENEEEQQKDNNEEKDEKKDKNSKEVKKEGELTKEEIQKQLGDKYVVAEIIVDEEISRELIGTQGFVGNPMIAYNKEEKKFEIVGNKGGGKLEKAKLPSIPASSGKVKRYDHKGEMINEEKGNVSSELLLINGNKDGIELGVTDYGEIVLNKQLNVNDINQQSRVSVPIDTKQKVPTTKEIEEMKENSDKTSELNNKLDSMETDGKISKNQRKNLEKKFATDGKTVEENLEELKKIENEKEEKEMESTQENEQKEQEEDEGWGPWESLNPYNRRPY